MDRISLTRSFLMPLTVLCIMLLAGTIVPLAAGSPIAPVPQSRDDSYQVQHRVEISEADITLEQEGAFTQVHIPNGVHLNEPGVPRIPSVTVRVAIPSDMQVTGLRVLRVDTRVLPGRHLVSPAQAIRSFEPTGDGPASRTAPNPAAYASAAPYPGKIAEYEHQADLAGQNFALVRLYPVQYTASEQELSLCSSIEFVLEGRPGHVCGDFLPNHASGRSAASYERMVRDLVANKDAVSLQRDRAAPRGGNLPPGDFEYVVITTAGWADAFAPLVAWKTKKGIPATTITPDWIYGEGGYEGTEIERIRAFVRDAHETWGTLYFLLGGRISEVPCEERWIVSVKPDESIPNDTFYADYDDDWVCEVHVGRVMARNTADVAIIINKILHYEKNPPVTDYARAATLLGMDQAPGGGEGENCKMDIRDLYFPEDWTIRTIYDSDPGEHKDVFIGYLNLGNNLVNHIDHATATSLGAGSTNHNDYLFAYNLLMLTNLERPSILYSISCYPVCLTVAQPIAETWLRAGNGAGVAFIGNTGPGFSESLSDDGESLRYDRYFFRSLFHQGHHRLGECFSDHKNDAYEDDDYYRWCFSELTLIGDPEMPIWTEDPQALDVGHPTYARVGQSTAFTVAVTSDGEGVVGATVCLSKSDDLYLVEETGLTGEAVFDIAPASSGAFDVTITAHNFLPYEGTATACAAGDVNCDDTLDLEDVAVFVNVLLGDDTDALHVIASDLDGSGLVDGSDVQPFVELLLAP